jgi:hypothetical protein
MFHLRPTLVTPQGMWLKVQHHFNGATIRANEQWLFFISTSFLGIFIPVIVKYWPVMPPKQKFGKYTMPDRK